jgi:hypothetical protein
MTSAVAAIIYGETSEAYHANPAIGSTDARAFLRSPRLFRDQQDGLEAKETPAMAFGTTAHMSVLEPASFAERRVIQPETYPCAKGPSKWTYGAAYCKAWRDEQHAAGRVIVTTENERTLLMMHERMPDQVKRIFATGRTEVTVRTIVEGLALQCRVDCWDEAGAMKYEFKTISAIEKVETEIWRRGYHIQERWYSYVIAMATGEKPPASRLVFVETAAPYRWRIVQLDLDYIFLGDRAVGDALAGIKARTKSGCWDDPAPLELMASPPPWMNDSDEALDDEEEA